MRRSLLAAVVCGGVVAIPALVSAHPLPGAPSCPVFPADNPWNQRVDRLPVAKDSARLVASIGLGSPVHPDFGTVYNGAPNGIPFVVVSGHTRRVPVSFQYADESDRGPYPIPPKRADRGRPELERRPPRDRGRPRNVHRLRAVRRVPPPWRGVLDGRLGSDLQAALEPPASSGLDVGGRRRAADPPGAGALRRGGPRLDRPRLRFTAPCTAPRYVYPARHEASTCSGFYPPMGLRVRLKAGVNISGLPFQARVVAQALKTYGMILADNGSPWYISGAPNPAGTTTRYTSSISSPGATSRSSTRARCPGRGGRTSPRPRSGGGNARPAARRYVVEHRSGRREVRLTEHDLRLLSFLAEHRLALETHLERLLGVSAVANSCPPTDIGAGRVSELRRRA